MIGGGTFGDEELLAYLDRLDVTDQIVAFKRKMAPRREALQLIRRAAQIDPLAEVFGGGAAGVGATNLGSDAAFFTSSFSSNIATAAATHSTCEIAAPFTTTGRTSVR